LSRSSAVRLTVVVLAYGDEPLLDKCVRSVLASDEVDVDVVVVDNGCTSKDLETLRGLPRVMVLTPGRNLGFAGGCNLGAEQSDAAFVGFVNGDAVVRPTALARLAAEAARPDVGLASASLRLLDAPEELNSVGNPVHYLGLSWAGALGEPASTHPVSTDVTSVTGAAVVARREVFQRLGGFCELMFAYCEDAELSLRAWQRGWRCVYVPSAVVVHHYEFSRNAEKLYLLERNRLLLVSTLYERRTLALLGPALVGLELAMLAVALRSGWATAKIRGWWWLLRHRRALADRRRAVQAARTRSDADLAPLLTGDFDPGPEAGFAAPPVLRRGSRAYWALVRRLV
jgi:GT2 family glycosyltransferase